MLAAVREVHPDGAIELRDRYVRPLVFDGSTSFETVLRLGVIRKRNFFHARVVQV